MNSYKVAVETENYICLRHKDEDPLIVHFVRSGFTDGSGNKKWFVFQEDAYELEPAQTGVQLKNEDQIYKEYGFHISKHYKFGNVRLSNQIVGKIENVGQRIPVTHNGIEVGYAIPKQTDNKLEADIFLIKETNTARDIVEHRFAKFPDIKLSKQVDGSNKVEKVEASCIQLSNGRVS